VTAFQKSLVYGLGVILMISTITVQATGEQALVVGDEADEGANMIEADRATCLSSQTPLETSLGFLVMGTVTAVPSLPHRQRTLSTGANRCS
jgi:hypothetical protein